MTARTTLTWTVVLTVGSAAIAMAAVVKLKDGTAFPGQVLQKDSERVIAAVPRNAVASVDGQPLPPPMGAGAIAPDFSVTDLAGVTHTLSSYRGQSIVLQFWATWCPHCRSDVKMIKELYTRYQGKGVQFLTVSIDTDRKKLDEFLKTQEITYPVVDGASSPSAPGATLSTLFEAQGVPHYFVIDAKGVIANTSSGSFTDAGQGRRSSTRRAGR